jgi:metal-responsive CopG/Arc/MetJ family transcriptional regulator
MKRITVTLPDDLAQALAAYVQEKGVSHTKVMQTALREYLQNRQLLERDYQPARRTIRITPAAQGSGVSDVSIEHDRYFAE